MCDVYLCSFADSRMSQTLRRVRRQAKESGFFKEIYLCNESLFDTSFKSMFSDKLHGTVRGFGYWVWKPYVILETLKKIPDNSILLYMDAGCHINSRGRDLFDSLVKKVIYSKSGILALELTDDFRESYYTKGDLLDFFDVRNRDDISLTPQRVGSILFLRNEEKVCHLVTKWLSVFETNFCLIDDSLSKSPNLPGFIENRHDQSVFSILTKLYDVEIFPLALLYDEVKSPILPLHDRKLNLIYRYSLRRFLSKCITKLKL